MCDRTKKIFIVLWGMPGAGKSTIGKQLAELLCVPFIDTDDLLERELGMSLQQGLEKFGYRYMREREGQVVLNASLPEQAVVATGGSVVYSEQAVNRLRGLGLNVYLDVDLKIILERVKNWDGRGFNRAPDQSIESVFEERQARYIKAAHYRLNCNVLTEQETCAAIVNQLNV